MARLTLSLHVHTTEPLTLSLHVHTAEPLTLSLHVHTAEPLTLSLHVHTAEPLTLSLHVHTAEPLTLSLHVHTAEPLTLSLHVHTAEPLTLSLSTYTLQNPIGVIIGGTVGHSLCTALAVIGGKMVAQRISVKTGEWSRWKYFTIYLNLTLFDVGHSFSLSPPPPLSLTHPLSPPPSPLSSDDHRWGCVSSVCSDRSAPP